MILGTNTSPHLQNAIGNQPSSRSQLSRFCFCESLIQQASILLTPSDAGSEFQRKYFTAMQQSPEVVLAHSEFAGLLGPARLSKEIH